MKKFLLLCLLSITGAICKAEDCNLESFIGILGKHVACLSEAQQGDITLRGAYFKDVRIQQCANKIEHGDNLKPLKLLWSQVAEDGQIDEKFIGEFCLLLFLSYESIITQLSDAPIKRSSWFAIVSLYAQLSSLPLNKLFEALDACWTQYQKMLNSYQVEGEYSLKKWLKEFWWIIPTTVAFVIVSYARWQKTRVAE